MYNKILVPLDGSELAECVLPHVQAIATGCQAKSVVVARVLEPFYLPAGGWEGYIDPKDITRVEAERKNAAEIYLRDIAAKPMWRGVNLQTVLLSGRPAETLVEYAEKNKVDLVVIATHGRSGVSRWVMGSVADRIVRSCCVPVFMVRAPGCLPGI